MASRSSQRRGGYRKPSTPAAASGPGALSGRTDGGPGQPIRVASGGDYGSRKASREQQAAAPLRSGGPATPPVTAGGFGGAPAPSPAEMLWSPSERPWEPLTSGARLGPGRPLEQPDTGLARLEALLAADPDNDALAEIIEELRG